MKIQEKPSDFLESVALALDLAAVIQNLAVLKLMIVFEDSEEDIRSKLLF